MHPALTGPQCKTGREAGYSKTPGSGAENACVQDWNMGTDAHSTENRLSIVFKNTSNLNLRTSHKSESSSKLPLLKFTHKV